jgi:hypothetical protein
MCKIIDVVVGSASESEIGAGYLTAQDAVPMRITLAELGHPQPPTPMQVDNTTMEAFANDTLKQKRSKAMDMRWHWLKDRVRQGQFLIYYRPGKDNYADPFTKHHTPTHIAEMTPKFIRRTEQLALAVLLFPSVPLARTELLANLVISYLVRGCVISGARRPSLRPRQPCSAGRQSVITATLHRHKESLQPIDRSTSSPTPGSAL